MDTELYPRITLSNNVRTRKWALSYWRIECNGQSVHLIVQKAFNFTCHLLHFRMMLITSTLYMFFDRSVTLSIGRTSFEAILRWSNWNNKGGCCHVGRSLMFNDAVKIFIQFVYRTWLYEMLPKNNYFLVRGEWIISVA